MNKTEALLKLKKELESRKDIPLISSPNDVVFGDGNPDSKIMFIGEAAGYHESVQHKPFVGQAGKLLDKLIASIGLNREDVYISNIVKTRPPENRDPSPEEIDAFKPYLDGEIDIIDPEIIVTLGRFSMGKFLPFEKISGIHGKPRSIIWKGKERLVIPMYHPAAALRAGAIMRQLAQDFQVIKQELEKLEMLDQQKQEEARKPKQDSLF